PGTVTRTLALLPGAPCALPDHACPQQGAPRMHLRSARWILAASCAMATALTALGPANLAAAAPAASPCASPLRQAISLAISATLPDPAGPPVPCTPSAPAKDPAAKAQAAAAADPVAD